MPDAAAYFASLERDFRQGVDSRRKAAQLLAGINTPLVPSHVTLSTPFLIWAMRNGTQATTMLTDSHIESENNWARARSGVRDGGDFLTWDQVGFYFFLENSSSTDVVVNAQSLLMLIGNSWIHANAGWLWTPFWSGVTIGNCTVRASVELTPWQWWDQPPTWPLREANQNVEAFFLTVDGGWALYSGGANEEAMVSGTFHVLYDSLLVPANGVVVFEVSLILSYEGYDGSGYFDFDSEGFKILCPDLQLDILSPPQMVIGGGSPSQ